jgi:flagellin-like protein
VLKEVKMSAFFGVGMGRRGVSPLIATVLLIAFSVALGAVVMNWGRGFISDRTSEVDSATGVQMQCSVDIDVDFVVISGVKKVCYDSTSDEVRLIVENKGVVNITGVRIQVITNNTILNDENTTTLMPGESIRYIISEVADEPDYVSVSPMITPIGSTTKQVCANNKIEISTINDC